MARSATGDRVLVVLEKQVVKEDYSKFWASLQGESSSLQYVTGLELTVDQREALI